MGRPQVQVPPEMRLIVPGTLDPADTAALLRALASDPAWTPQEIYATGGGAAISALFASHWRHGGRYAALRLLDRLDGGLGAGLALGPVDEVHLRALVQVDDRAELGFAAAPFSPSAYRDTLAELLAPVVAAAPTVLLLAVDLDSGQPVWFDRPTPDAIMAAAARPALCDGVTIGGRRHLGGHFVLGLIVPDWYRGDPNAQVLHRAGSNPALDAALDAANRITAAATGQPAYVVLAPLA